MLPELLERLTTLRDHAARRRFVATQVDVEDLSAIIALLTEPSGRKIAGLSLTPHEFGFYALAECDDGTWWVFNYGQWQQLPEIPQPKG